MATHSMHRRRTGVSDHTRTKERPLACALLLAILCSHVVVVAASPLPSLPASTPGFISAAAAGASTVHEAVPDSVIETSSQIDPVRSAADLDEEDEENDDDGGLDYEDADQADQADDGRMSINGMGNAIEKAAQSTPE